MIDTIRIQSPEISEDVANIIESRLIVRMAVDMKTGEQLYKFTADSLEGSYDTRIMIKLDYNKHLERCITVEGSVHKNLMGQNAVGMVEDFRLCVFWLVGLISEQFNIKLPPWQKWVPKRIDFAKVFDLGSTDNVKKYLKGLSDLTYPRRQVVRYGQTGLFVKGSTSSIKFYHKGVEFAKHDLARVKRFFDINAIYYFRELVDRLLRVEVEIKSRKIESKYGDLVTCNDIEVDWLREVYEKEVGKLLKEHGSMRVVRTCDAVKDRLYGTYSKRLAGVLYGTWFMLTTHGEDGVREILEERTYRRHIKQLKDAGVSWHNSDINVESNLIEFVPSLHDKRLVNWVSEDCYKLLRRVEIAS